MNDAPSLSITDPTGSRLPRSLLARLAATLIVDPRDLPFLGLIASASLVVIPFAAYLFLAERFPWWLGGIYLAVNLLGFVDRYILMLHNTSHRVLFRPGVRWLNHYIPWVLGPFFGETPETYFAHHLGMHHPENNLADDLSSTMRFERDRIDHFLRYFFRFFFLSLPELTAYLWRRGRRKLAWKCVLGELSFYALVGLLSTLNLRATLVVFVIPYLLVRFLMMAGNWGQHAFIHPDDPANPYRNSITCINTRYNRRAFNDGYHIGHHVKANRHWTEMPGDFLANVERYAREDAVVFEGIDFFQVWLYLMLRRYDVLARHYVQLRAEPRSPEAIVALLRERVRAFPAAA